MKQKLKVPLRGASKDYVPTEEEFDRILDAVKGERDRVIVYTLSEGGFRATEFASIMPYWLHDGRVVVPKYDPQTGFKVKTSASSRAVPLKKMSRAAWDVLNDYVEKHDGIDFCYGTTWLRVKNLARRAKLTNNFFPHAFRAYCATKWAYRIPNPYVLMDIFGWATMGVALKYIRRAGVRAEQTIDKWNMEQMGVL